MGVDLHYKMSNAKIAGVTFEPLTREEYICNEHCSCKHGVEYCDGDATLQTFADGFYITCPNGATGYSIIDGLFQCKSMNHEIRDYFIKNVIGSKMSY